MAVDNALHAEVHWRLPDNSAWPRNFACGKTDLVTGEEFGHCKKGKYMVAVPDPKARPCLPCEIQEVCCGGEAACSNFTKEIWPPRGFPGSGWVSVGFRSPQCSDRVGWGGFKCMCAPGWRPRKNYDLPGWKCESTSPSQYFLDQ